MPAGPAGAVEEPPHEELAGADRHPVQTPSGHRDRDAAVAIAPHVGHAEPAHEDAALGDDDGRLAAAEGEVVEDCFQRPGTDWMIGAPSERQALDSLLDGVPERAT